MQTVKKRFERLRLAQKWTWTELARQLGISLSLLMQIKAGKRGLSNKVAHDLIALELAAKIPLEPQDEAFQAREVAQPYTLHKKSVQTEPVNWQRRAELAEQKLNALRLILGLYEGEEKISSDVTAAELETVLRLSKAELDRQRGEGGQHSPPKSGPSAISSPKAKTGSGG